MSEQRLSLTPFADADRPREAVRAFGLVELTLDRLPELDAIDVLQDEERFDDLGELLEGSVQRKPLSSLVDSLEKLTSSSLRRDSITRQAPTREAPRRTLSPSTVASRSRFDTHKASWHAVIKRINQPQRTQAKGLEMDTQATDLLNQALKLPADTREDLAARLMGSIGTNDSAAAEAKQAWLEEIDRRIARFESGESASIPIEEAWPKITGQPWRSQAGGDA